MYVSVTLATLPLEVSTSPRIIAGRYELVRVLGRGSMGEVWVAEHLTLGQEVAVKLLSRPPWGEEVEDSSTSAARFRFEAQVAARLSAKTRHIVRVTDHGEERGVAYLVMELLDGVTLETRLMRRGCMAPEEIANVVTQLSRALEHAHDEGVLHRDLKPSNVFLAVDEDGALLVKAFDFGIACLTRSHRLLPTRLTAQGLLFGTPGYMSPEQARGSLQLDLQCDLWALATIAYEELTGELPIDGADADELLKNLGGGRMVPLRERCGELSEALEAFFQRAFASEAKDRFPSATEMARAFEEAAERSDERCPPRAPGPSWARCDEGPPVEDPMVAPPTPRGLRRRHVVATAASLLFGFAVACACGLSAHASDGVAARTAVAAPAIAQSPLAPPEAPFDEAAIHSLESLVPESPAASVHAQSPPEAPANAPALVAPPARTAEGAHSAPPAPKAAEPARKAFDKSAVL